MCQTPSAESVHELYERKQYAEIIRLVPASASNSAELDLYRGLALAQLQRFSEAKASLEDGERKNPREERFPVELAGVAYRTNDLNEAERDLRRALRLKPQDSYTLNFLATVYLLRGNLPAALKYWNRIKAPRVSQIEESPQPRVNRPLLDRAITVSPLSTLRLRDFETSDALVGALGIFPNRHWELRPDGPDNYKLILHSFEEGGWGVNKWSAALSLVRGLPYETVYPEYRDAHGAAINFDSLVR
ncbi:MAG: tetratricopeptide repeat protein, partial [Candidatus Acidiferrales bacterium]